MKKKKLDMHKLSLKKSTVAKYQSDNLVGGYWGFTGGCRFNTFAPGEPCGPTDICPPPTVGCGPAPTVGCGPAPTVGCNPPPTLDANCPSHSICPRGIQCF